MMFSKCKVLSPLALAAFLMWSASIFAADDYATWGNSRVLQLNTTATGTNVSTDITGFPVLIRLAAANFPAGAKEDGTDIRFAKTGGAHLAYQIERWDNAKSEAEIWVKADVLGNNNTQSITMYWGKADAGDSSSGSAVFDAANGFVGVWHLGEAGNTDVDGYKDATGNGNNGTGYQTTGIEVPSAIGIGQAMLGTATANNPGTGLGCYIKIPDATINPASGTISMWVNTGAAFPTGTGNADAFGSWNTNNARYFFGCDATGKLRAMFGPSANIASAYTFALNSFYHIAMSWTGTTTQIAKLYVNDTLRGTSAAVTQAAPTQINIGSFGAGFSDPWKGQVDECRVDNVGRSADWIKLCYESQKPGSTFVSFGTTLNQSVSGKLHSNVLELQAEASKQIAGQIAIRYTLPQNTTVSLSVFNQQGALVKKIASAESKLAGSYSVQWDGRDELNRTVTSGSYICRIDASGTSQARAFFLSK